MLTWLRGCAYPLWPMWFSVYASCILLCSRLPQSKPLATLRRIRNTRYGWLVKPYEISILGFLPSGTFTLKEATSFACRTNASFSSCREGRVFCRLFCKMRDAYGSPLEAFVRLLMRKLLIVFFSFQKGQLHQNQKAIPHQEQEQQKELELQGEKGQREQKVY